MKQITKLLEDYTSLNTGLSLEEEQKIIAEYVYSTNQLEGNQLTFENTISLISKNVLIEGNARFIDILEHKGTHRSLIRLLNAIIKKEQLSIDFIKELNWLLIGDMFKSDDFYKSYKDCTQIYGDFKVKNNKIQITFRNGRKQILEPKSTPETAETNLKITLSRLENSPDNIIDKACFLAKEIWLQQPFIDGNKRTARLLINFLLMKEGFPLFTYLDIEENFNDVLVQEYVTQTNELLPNYINKLVTKRLEKLIIENKY